jgi:ribosomal protein S18 acetylase RimI-like enzyme
VNVEIKLIDTWETYRSAWRACAESLPWVKEKKFIHYNLEEELEELKEEFQNTSNRYLVAYINKQEIIGCLSIRIRNNQAMLRRWEPLVQENYSFKEIGKRLLDEGLRILKDMFVQTVHVMLKYEFNETNEVMGLLDLFLISGFVDSRPPAIQFIKDVTTIDKVNKVTEKIKDIVIKTRESFEIADFCNLSMKAFASTEEDKEIHGWDKITTDYETCMRFNQRIFDGKQGYSPAEFWLVATINDQPAGFIIGTGPKRADDQQIGVIGILGILPQYRGKGVAFRLVSELEKKFIKTNYSFSFVGTSETNIGAIKFYEKLLYVPIQRIVYLCKNLHTDI